MQIPANFTVLPETQKGDVYGTEFQFEAGLPLGYNKLVWDFGDKTLVYNNDKVTHAYNYPGVYKVSLSAWNDLGILVTDQADIDVDYVKRDAIIFEEIPSQFGVPGQKSVEPFTVTLTSSRITEPLSIVLQSFNTRSIPYYAVPDKWRFLTPTWKFLDASTDQILDGPIPVSTVPLYNEDNKVVAVSGKASFYYIDDLSTGTDPTEDCPLLLAATLSTENFVYPPESLNYPYYSYSNSEVARAVIAWQISDVIPTELKVSENFLNEIHPVKWAGVPIPVMVTCKFNPLSLESFSRDCEGVDPDNLSYNPTNVLAYPRTNELGAVSPLILTLSGVSAIPSSYYRVDETPLYFRATDENNNSANGYVFTTVTPLSPIDFTVVVTASTVATNQPEGANSFSFPDGYPIYPEVYISHPFAGSINRVNLVTYPSDCENINYYKRLGLLTEGVASFVEVPRLSTTDVTNYNLSGTAAVYGMAFNPVVNRLYASDADQDVIYSFRGGKNLTKTIKLSEVTGDDYNTPAYISIDKDNNVWVSLYNHQRLLKFDCTLEYLLSAAPSLDIPLDTTEENSGLGGFGSYLVAPPIVETDRENNVWACYAHPLSSMLVKFDSEGNELFKATSLSPSSVPVSLTMNVDGDFWVACYAENSLHLYSTDGSLLSSVYGSFIHPSYIATDRRNNIWVTHGYDLCSVFNTKTQEISSWKISGELETVTRYGNYTQQDTALALTENEIWGGLAVDVFNRVWVIDSENNKAVVFSSIEPENARFYNVIPGADKNYILRSNDDYVTEIPMTTVRSAQAAGDWTGNRWYQKYTGDFNSVPVSGVSAPFRVFDINSSFKLAKVNEEFDMAGYFKSLALPEVLNQNSKLFDEFLAAIAGDGIPTTESIGRVIYERIANFVSNHADFETAEIEQLLSFAAQLSIGAKTYGVDFPAEVNRLLNIFSVPKHLLRGQKNYQTDIETSIGPLLNTNSILSAGQFIYMKDKFFEKYQLIGVAPLLSGTQTLTSYPLEFVEIEGTRLPLLENYLFFEYNEVEAGYKNNIINWDSPNTTISYTLSTNEEWYGEGGLVETMFNSLLTKRLFDV